MDVDSLDSGGELEFIESSFCYGITSPTHEMTSRVEVCGLQKAIKDSNRFNQFCHTLNLLRIIEIPEMKSYISALHHRRSDSMTFSEQFLHLRGALVSCVIKLS